MAISEKDLLQILEWLEKSSWEELRLETPAFKLVVSKSGRPPAPEPAHARAMPAAPRSLDVRSEPAASHAPAAPTAAAAPALEAHDASWIAVRSPTLGNFYVAPAPGAAPFVMLGQQVAAADTVAIVEVMKLMNHIAAGASGRIARVCAQNGELVAEDQVLFLIDPVAADG
jgi:acetyl-CoA carboxylase biotin carboxyl carrier protein